MRAVSTALAFSAFVFIALAALTPVHAQTIRVADVTPLSVPADLVAVRNQPALGATQMPIEPGQQKLSPQLLANYVARQNALRAFDVTGNDVPGELNTQTLMSYIARSAQGGSNGALTAIASFAPQNSREAEPTLTADIVSAYVDDGYLPFEKRMEQANSERGCLAQAIYHEARGESQAGQMAVANVILNRALSGKYPDTICGVVYQNANKGRYRCQFTFACDGRDDAPGERSAWARSQGLAADVYRVFAQGNDLQTLPRSALFYHTTNSNPSWSNTYSRVAQIGSHIFYSPN